jgi:RNA polymerase sigma-70 factor (ECF subfamily)
MCRGPAAQTMASMTCHAEATVRPAGRARVLDADRLPDHIDRLYRAAWALCGSRHDAEDLVQETFASVLKRPRLLRDGNEIGYLLRTLKNVYVSGRRAAARRPSVRELFDEDGAPSGEEGATAHEVMQAIASAPPPYRDAVIAVDLLGLSYREAARSLRTREATVTTRLYRGRRHVARELRGESAQPAAPASTSGS